MNKHGSLTLTKTLFVAKVKEKIMKKIILMLAISIIIVSQLFAIRTPAVIKTLSAHNDVNILNKYDIDIDNVTSTEITVYVDDNELAELLAMGFDIYRIPYRAKEYADSLWQATKDSDNPMDDYHNYDELTAFLQNIESQYPDICKLITVGQSVQGRELWFMKISDNVDIEEDEPEFKYIANMHGDEPVGRELLIYLITLITDNYGIDPRFTKMVDSLELWIMPSMNPDGFEMHTRYNANGVDLNRNFPDPITNPVNTPAGREPETQAIMYHAFGHSSVLSANFHTGALVVNYPYDCMYQLTPDNDLFIDISLAYSIHNGPMYYGSFPQGITNGAQWYIIHGGMQDWNYYWMGDNEVTVEQCNDKWPSASWLPGLWDDNRESMLSYIETIYRGIRGIVTDTQGIPLDATIVVDGIDHEVYTDPDVGDYHRMLLPGTYSITVSAEGYVPQSINNIVVVDSQATRVDVQLVSGSSVDIHNNKVGSIPVLEQNYPNPFNPITNIRYYLPKKAKVEIGIYNILGQKINTLVDCIMESGYHNVIWTGKDENNNDVSSGIYLYKINTDNFTETKRMVLIK